MILKKRVAAPGAGALLFFGLAGILLLIFWSRLSGNFHAVVPGRVYRSAQLTPAELEERIRQHGLRSILNLRGDKEDRDWYREEVEIASRHRIAFRSVDLVPERLPSRPALVALIDALESLPEPVLVHCGAGADRAGFASVVARMAKQGLRLDEAASELSLRYGHLPFGPATALDGVFDAYRGYLGESGSPDGWESFERWARERYVPYVYSARIELDPARPAPVEIAVAAGERMDIALRLTNTSPGRWTPVASPGAGIKLGVRLRTVGDERWLDYDRHDVLSSPLGSGESRVLSVPVSAPREAGRYELELDMVDEHVTWFEEQGSRPLVLTLAVR
jgi:protein tyrosine/serine phosphatase